MPLDIDTVIKLHNSGLTHNEIAELTSFTKQYICKRLRARDKAVMQDEKACEQICMLFESGLDAEQIGNKMSCSARAVICIASSQSLYLLAGTKERLIPLEMEVCRQLVYSDDPDRVCSSYGIQPEYANILLAKYGLNNAERRSIADDSLDEKIAKLWNIGIRGYEIANKLNEPYEFIYSRIVLSNRHLHPHSGHDRSLIMTLKTLGLPDSCIFIETGLDEDSIRNAVLRIRHSKAFPETEPVFSQACLFCSSCLKSYAIDDEIDDEGIYELSRSWSSFGKSLFCPSCQKSKKSSDENTARLIRCRLMKGWL